MKKVILQCLLLILFPLLGLIISLENPLYVYLAMKGNEVEPIRAFFTLLPFGERGVSVLSGLLISTLIWIPLTRSNKEKVFNNADKYGDHPKVVYLIAAKFLRYKTISLINVPIYLQFYLVIHGVFDNFKIDENVSERSQAVSVGKRNMELISNEMNLVLSDTYKISKEQIPFNKRHLPTITISNGNEFNGVRNFNTNFFEEVRIQTNTYSHNYGHINIFATTNTNHNKAIIESCFNNAGRTGFKNLSVFQFNTIERSFIKEHPILNS